MYRTTETLVVVNNLCYHILKTLYSCNLSYCGVTCGESYEGRRCILVYVSSVYTYMCVVEIKAKDGGYKSSQTAKWGLLDVFMKQVCLEMNR